jgi:hypothetical protein
MRSVWLSVSVMLCGRVSLSLSVRCMTCSTGSRDAAEG